MFDQPTDSPEEPNIAMLLKFFSLVVAPVLAVVAKLLSKQLFPPP